VLGFGSRAISSRVRTMVGLAPPSGAGLSPACKAGGNARASTPARCKKQRRRIVCFMVRGRLHRRGSPAQLCPAWKESLDHAFTLPASLPTIESFEMILRVIKDES